MTRAVSLIGSPRPSWVVPGVQEEGVAAELEHADLEGDPGAGRALLEDHRQGLALEQAVRLAALLLGLQLAAEGEDLLQFGPAPVGQAEKVLVHGRLLGQVDLQFIWKNVNAITAEGAESAE